MSIIHTHAMADVSYYLLQFLNSSTLDLITLTFFLSFLVWEIPRFTKMIEESWIHGLYPEHGRVVDIILLLAGVGSYLLLISSTKNTLALAYKPIFNFVIAAAIIALPIVIILGFLGRIFSRMDAKVESAGFFVQTILDFVHSVFFVCFALLIIPAAALLISAFL
jgi:hypothetical protein